MRFERRVPRLTETLFSGGIALVCEQDGQLMADGPFGLFAGDTRMISTYRLSIGGHPWTLLGRSRAGRQRVEWVFQNPRLQSPSPIRAGALAMHLARTLDHSLVDEYRIEPFIAQKARVAFTIQLDADFADIFEVKEQSIRPRLNVCRQRTKEGFVLSYENGDFQRAVRIDIRSACRPSFSGALIVFEFELSPGQSWDCRLELELELDHRTVRRGPPPTRPSDYGPAVEIESDGVLAEPFRQGCEDLRGLAMRGSTDKLFIAAGVPWFMTLFGRDTLITGLMSGLDGSWSTRGALSELGERLAQSFDSFRDAEPGKLPHEVRTGELAREGSIPHAAYYGTHDAPSLYCLALWNSWRFTGDSELLRGHLDTARAALKWCDELGDRDVDELQEYGTRSREGYFNQSWKDAGDAILHADGSLPELPLATVELQGYLFAARLAMAELVEACGEHGEAEELRQKALRLQQAVERAFFMERENYYGVGLDGNKRLMTSITSNPLHLLWCGLPSMERARAVAERAFEVDLFSGWGIRTISSHHPSCNPVSYQLGSVWPHDNAIAVAGLCRYGFFDLAFRLMRPILEAANSFESSRLPEVYTGFDRESGLPLPYEKANSPQAWAAAAPILFAQVLLGLVPDAPRGRCYLSPRLPPWLPRLEMRGIELGGGRLDVTVARLGDKTVVEKCRPPTGIEMIQQLTTSPLWGAPPLL